MNRSKCLLLVALASCATRSDRVKVAATLSESKPPMASIELDDEVLTPLPRLESGGYRCDHWTLERHEASGNHVFEFAGDERRNALLLACGKNPQAYVVDADTALILGDYGNAPREDGLWVRAQLVRRGRGIVLRYDMKRRLLGTDGLGDVPKVKLVCASDSRRRVHVILMDRDPVWVLAPRVVGLRVDSETVASDVRLPMNWGYYLPKQSSFALVDAREVFGGRFVALCWSTRNEPDRQALRAITFVPIAGESEGIVHVVVREHDMRLLPGGTNLIVPGDRLRLDGGGDDVSLPFTFQEDGVNAQGFLRASPGALATVSVELPE